MINRASSVYHGWVMVWVLAICTTVGYGILYYSFAVFLHDLERDLGCNRAQSSLSFTIATVCAGLTAPWVGRMTDRHGTRGVIAGGMVLASVLTFAWSRVSSLPMLYLIAAGLGMTMPAVFYDPAFTVVAVWFRRHRSKALLVITLAGGLASTIFVPLSTFLLERLGWRSAVVVLAGILLLLAPLAWLTLRRHPHDLGLEVDGLPRQDQLESAPKILPSTREWLRSRNFWSIAVGVALARTAVGVFSVHLVLLLRERGVSSYMAASVVALIGVMQLLGRVVVAPLTSVASTPTALGRGQPNRWSLAVLNAFVFVVHGLGVVALASNTDWGIWLFVIFYGSTNGAITLARAALTAEQFDPRIFGAVNGAMALIGMSLSALMPVLAGILHERSGSYSSTLLVVIALVMVSSLIVLGAQRKDRVGMSD